MSAEEQIFLSDGGIIVSNARFVVAGQTYPIIAISSVKMSEKPPEQTGNGCAIGCGGLIALFSIGPLIQAISAGFSDVFPMVLILTIVGVALVVIGVMNWSALKTKY